jgi:hypothetical protein
MLLVASPASAQQKPAPEKPPAKEASDSKPKEATKPAPEVALPVNVRIELTITDQRGDTTPVTKVVSMIASDRSWSRIRTGGEQRTAMGMMPVILNVDARPLLLPRDTSRARVELTIEYRPAEGRLMPGEPSQPPDASRTTPNINESLVVVLDDGKPMLISQSADPVTDRKVKVEVKATILK